MQDSKNNLHISNSAIDNGGEYYCYGYNSDRKIYFLSRVYYVVIGKLYNFFSLLKTVTFKTPMG